MTKALALRRLLWKNEVFGPNEGGAWRVRAGNLLICERSADFFVAVTMGTEPVRLPEGSVLLSAYPLAEDGWLQPNNAVWVLRTASTGHTWWHIASLSMDAGFRSGEMRG